MTELETAWLAGILEGEGSIVFTNLNSVALTVFMVDEDVVRRCQAVTASGTVRGPYQDKRPGHQPIWKWSVNKNTQTEAILRAVYPWMGYRRGARIEAALDRLSRSRGRNRCHQGHSNWYQVPGGSRYCRDCRNVLQRLRRSRAKELVHGRPVDDHQNDSYND